MLYNSLIISLSYCSTILLPSSTSKKIEKKLLLYILLKIILILTMNSSIELQYRTIEVLVLLLLVALSHSIACRGNMSY